MKGDLCDSDLSGTEPPGDHSPSAAVAAWGLLVTLEAGASRSGKAQ